MFSHIPKVTRIDDFWYKKVQARKSGAHHKHRIDHYSDIHMPKTAVGFIISVFAALFGFAMIWHVVLLCCLLWPYP